MTKTVESPSIPATQTDDTIPSPSEFDAAVSAARQVSVTVGRYRQEVSALNTRIRTLESEREVHMAKLLPPSDFINFLDEYVDRRAEEGRAVLRSQVSAIVHPERYGSSPKGGTWPVMSYGDVAAALGQDSATLAKWLHDHLPLPMPNTFGQGAGATQVLIFVLREQLKAALRDALAVSPIVYHGASQNDIGLPLVERRARIEEIDRDLSELRAKRQELNLRISKLGASQ